MKSFLLLFYVILLLPGCKNSNDAKHRKMQIQTIQLMSDYTFRNMDLGKMELQQEGILKGMRPIDKNKKLTIDELTAFNRGSSYLDFIPSEKEISNAKNLLWEISKIKPIMDRIIELATESSYIYVKEKPFRLLKKITGKSSISYSRIDRIETKISILKNEISSITKLPKIDDYIKKNMIDELSPSSTKY
jgi:hypothetical protein